MASGHLELFPFVVLAICVLSMMAMAGGISEHMLTSWSICLWFLFMTSKFYLKTRNIIQFTTKSFCYMFNLGNIKHYF